LTEKLPLLPGRKVAQAFIRLGWQVARQKGSHIVLVATAENYIAAPMRHRIEPETGSATAPQTVSDSWRFRGRENRMELSADGNAVEPAEGSDVEFITEHYWGYARRRGCSEEPRCLLGKIHDGPGKTDRLGFV
jgi:predicted RNA binding protein YcfA (HicA-like mRNA interferase family)